MLNWQPANHMIIITMTLRKILLLTAVIGSCLASPVNNESPIITDRHCSNPGECNSNECCAMHPMTYSPPTCKPLRLEGEPCVPRPRKLQAVLTIFLDGSAKLYTDVFWVLCTCAPNLTCDWESGLCSKQTNITSGPFNGL